MKVAWWIVRLIAVLVWDAKLQRIKFFTVLHLDCLYMSVGQSDFSDLPRGWSGMTAAITGNLGCGIGLRSRRGGEDSTPSRMAVG